MRYCIWWIFMHFQERVLMWRIVFHALVLGLLSLTGVLFVCMCVCTWMKS